MSLLDLQTRFVAALREPSAEVPEGVVVLHRSQRTRRFNVYRNSVFASLTVALEARFPVVARLVGTSSFARWRGSSSIARRHHRPFSQSMARVSAVSRAVRACRGVGVSRRCGASRMGAERSLSRPRCPGAFDRRVVGDRAGCRWGCRPIRASFGTSRALPVSVVSIWTTNTHDDEVQAIAAGAASEAALVARPKLDVLVTPISQGSALLFERLASGDALGAAIAHVQAQEPHFDVGRGLADLFLGGAFDGLSLQDDKP